MSDDGEDGDGDDTEDEDCPRSDSEELPADPDEFRLGAILDALTHPTRRKALAYLDDCDGAVTLEELAGEIRGPFTLTDPLRRSVDREHHVEMQLYHVHAPKLAAEGLVAFDPEDRTVTITEEGEEALRRLF